MKQRKNKIHVGDTYNHKLYGEYTVVSIGETFSDITIQFSDTGYTYTTNKAQVQNIQVRDVMKPLKSYFDVGYVGEGKYKVGSRSAQTWRDMLRRCYCEKYQSTNEIYKNHTVCEEWHNYQNFAEWYEINYVDGHQLDKDKLQPNKVNKIYSPDTCVFVSSEENLSMVNEPRKSKFLLKCPNGIIHEVHGQGVFAKKHGLSQPSISALYTGKIKQYKGWRLA